MSKQIKWGCIQPLTGGMYIGALKAIGHHAEWILSYDGLDAVTIKDNEIIGAANEYNLRQWLNKNNGESIPYYQIKNRKMFDMDIHTKEIRIDLSEKENVLPDYYDMDLVVAVPVCSGLSVVTKAANETKESRNCNMQWITYYTLNVIKPKVYVFENAPTLVGDRGDDVRASLEDIAKNAGYSVLYYKTDTVLHHNCQRRPRTFVIFTQWQGEMTEQKPPLFGYEKDSILIPEFFESISKDAPQQTPVESFIHNYAAIDYNVKNYGENWADEIKDKRNIITYIMKTGKLEDFLKFVKESDKYTDEEKAKVERYFKHIFEKTSQGLNYYGEDAWVFKDYFPSVQFRSIPNMIHYTGKRFCTIREYLSLMGMPEDFIIYGDKTNLAKIGQNVPVNTAKFIVSQVVNILNNWEYNNREHTSNVAFQDNTKQEVIKEIKTESLF